MVESRHDRRVRAEEEEEASAAAAAAAAAMMAKRAVALSAALIASDDEVASAARASRKPLFHSHHDSTGGSRAGGWGAGPGKESGSAGGGEGGDADDDDDDDDEAVNIAVVSRCRPLLMREMKRGVRAAVFCDGSEIVVSGESLPNKRERRFGFDRVFGKPTPPYLPWDRCSSFPGQVFCVGGTKHSNAVSQVCRVERQQPKLRTQQQHTLPNLHARRSPHLSGRPRD